MILDRLIVQSYRAVRADRKTGRRRKAEEQNQHMNIGLFIDHSSVITHHSSLVSRHDSSVHVDSSNPARCRLELLYVGYPCIVMWDVVRLWLV